MDTHFRPICLTLLASQLKNLKSTFETCTIWVSSLLHIADSLNKFFSRWVLAKFSEQTSGFNYSRLYDLSEHSCVLLNWCVARNHGISTAAVQCIEMQRACGEQCVVGLMLLLTRVELNSYVSRQVVSRRSLYVQPLSWPGRLTASSSS